MLTDINHIHQGAFMKILYTTELARFRQLRKYKRRKLREQMESLKQQMNKAYDAVRYEQWFTDSEDYHAGVNQDYCRIVLCSPDGMGNKDTCDYFSFDKPCSYECDCCNQDKNRKYFELKAKYDQLCAKHTRLSWKNQLISLIRGKGFSL